MMLMRMMTMTDLAIQKEAEPLKNILFVKAYSFRGGLLIKTRVMISIFGSRSDNFSITCPLSTSVRWLGFVYPVLTTREQSAPMYILQQQIFCGNFFPNKMMTFLQAKLFNISLIWTSWM